MDSKQREFSVCQQMQRKWLYLKRFLIDGNGLMTLEQWVCFDSTHLCFFLQICATLASVSFLDAHTPASLLKLWYRELYNPLISEHLYEECVQTEDPKEAMKIVEKLPKSHKLVRKTDFSPF